MMPWVCIILHYHLLEVVQQPTSSFKSWQWWTRIAIENPSGGGVLVAFSLSI